MGEPVLEGVKIEPQEGGNFLVGRRTPLLAFNRGIGLRQGLRFVAHGPGHPVPRPHIIEHGPPNPVFSIGLKHSRTLRIILLDRIEQPQDTRADEVLQADRGGQAAGEPVRDVFDQGA
jgi:hypothetical protein